MLKYELHTKYLELISELSGFANCTRIFASFVFAIFSILAQIYDDFRIPSEEWLF